jgi:hypothetical protein
MKHNYLINNHLGWAIFFIEKLTIPQPIKKVSAGFGRGKFFFFSHLNYPVYPLKRYFQYKIRKFQVK